MLAELARLTRLSTARASELRALLLGSKYEDRPILSVETFQGTLMPEELRVPLIERALLRQDHPAARLTLLFQHLRPLKADVVDGALGRNLRRALVEAGVLIEEDGSLRSTLRMTLLD